MRAPRPLAACSAATSDGAASRQSSCQAGMMTMSAPSSPSRPNSGVMPKPAAVRKGAGSAAHTRTWKDGRSASSVWAPNTRQGTDR